MCGRNYPNNVKTGLHNIDNQIEKIGLSVYLTKKGNLENKLMVTDEVSQLIWVG